MRKKQRRKTRMSISQKLNETVIPAVMKFVNLKPVVALKDGILFILPLH